MSCYLDVDRTEGNKESYTINATKKYTSSIWKQIAIIFYTVAISLQSKTIVTFSIFIHFIYSFMMDLKTKVLII